MATSRVLRFACITAVGALAILLAYWAVAWGGGPVWIGVLGGHDGVLCYSHGTVGPSSDGRPVTSEIPCGVSFTIVFAIALFGMLAATVSGAFAIARGSRRAFGIAASASGMALLIVAFETARTFAGNGFSDGLGPNRGPLHAIVTAFALAAFALALCSRNAEAAPSPSPAP